MLFKNSIKKILADRGYKHCNSDEELSRHGDYARNIQYSFSKEHIGDHTQKVVDIITLAFDLRSENMVIGFFRENCAIENGILENSNVSIPLAKFSMEEFEKKIDRIIPRGSPLHKRSLHEDKF